MSVINHAGLPRAQRILVVDDQWDQRRLMAIASQSDNRVCVTATNGAEGLLAATEAHASGNDFDAIVMDISMPDRSGTEVARELRALGIDTPIVFCTANDGTINRHLAADVPNSMYLTKPVTPNTVIDTCDAALGKYKSDAP